MDYKPRKRGRGKGDKYIAARPDVDAFEAVMEREDRHRGFLVSFAFSADARQECTAYPKRIPLVPARGLLIVQEIQDKQFVQKM